MIELPCDRWNELLEWFESDISDSTDYGATEIKALTRGQPFLSDFEPLKYYICVLRKDIHDEVRSYALYQNNGFGEYGVERSIFIKFDDDADDVLFKLTYL